MKRFTCGATAIAAVLGLLLAAAPASRAAEMSANLKVGDKAPDFTLTDIEGRKVQLSSVGKDKAVLLAFWSIRCSGCLQEIPHLEKIHKSLGGKPATVLSVLIDGMDAAATKASMKDVQPAPSYTVLIDPEFTVADTFVGMSVVPLTMVIDRKGFVRYVHAGFKPGDEKQYETALQAAIAP